MWLFSICGTAQVAAPVANLKDNGSVNHLKLKDTFQPTAHTTITRPARQTVNQVHLKLNPTLRDIFDFCAGLSVSFSPTYGLELRYSENEKE